MSNKDAHQSTPYSCLNHNQIKKMKLSKVFRFIEMKNHYTYLWISHTRTHTHTHYITNNKNKKSFGLLSCVIFKMWDRVTRIKCLYPIPK
jgi:hypothetical protein